MKLKKAAQRKVVRSECQQRVHLHFLGCPLKSPFFFIQRKMGQNFTRSPLVPSDVVQLCCKTMCDNMRCFTNIFYTTYVTHNATCWCCSTPQRYSKAVGKHLLSETSSMKNISLFVFIFKVVSLSMIIFIFEIVLIFLVVLIFRLSSLLEQFSFLGLYSFWGHLPHLGTLKF